MEDPLDIVAEMSMNLVESLVLEPEKSKRRLLLREHLVQVTKSDSNKPVPDFKPGLDWLNVTEPLSLRKHFHGKIVLLDFFTYCCINCMHILPELKQLEQQYNVEDGFVVIGVHSAKFTNEKNTSNIESALKRFDVHHPVVNDVFEAMWKDLGICCWPTLYVVGPNSEPLLTLQGEGNFDTLRLFITEAIEFYKKRDELSFEPLSMINPYHRPITSNILSFPGKININKGGTMVGLSDTANHRILILSLDGDLMNEIGCGDSGLADGSFSTAKFFSPQGLAFYKDVIFVADTENHAIREVNLTMKVVRTIVGNGNQGHDYAGGQDGVKQEISSPWDVCLVDDILFIAMAGTHQIWAYFLEDACLWKKNYLKRTCAAVIGSGKEENRNNQYPMRCGLAQPSGLAYVGANKLLLIADSESSTVRCVHLETGAVTSFVGGSKDPKDLFAFGNMDGVGIEAKLQHPLSVTWSPYDSCAYIADSYNHKIKKVDMASKVCSTVGDYSKYQLNEPGGICALGDKLLISDTNNHCVKIMNLPLNSLSILDIRFMDNVPSIQSENSDVYSVQMSSCGGILNLSFALTLPDGIKLTPGAPSVWIVNLSGNRNMHADKNFSLSPKWDIPITKKDVSKEEIVIKCRIFLCSDNKCVVKEFKFSVVVNFSEAAPSTTMCHIDYSILLNVVS